MKLRLYFFLEIILRIGIRLRLLSSLASSYLVTWRLSYMLCHSCLHQSFYRLFSVSQRHVLTNPSACWHPCSQAAVTTLHWCQVALWKPASSLPWLSARQSVAYPWQKIKHKLNPKAIGLFNIIEVHANQIVVIESCSHVFEQINMLEPDNTCSRGFSNTSNRDFKRDSEYTNDSYRTTPFEL